jgi:hypothetical protein
MASVGVGDNDLPDSLAVDVTSAGRGSGMLVASSGSLVGIGNTSAPGYAHTTSEGVGAGGNVVVNGKVRWSSFPSFDLIIFSGLISQV